MNITPLVHPTHTRMHQLTMRYGTDSEKAESQQTIAFMDEFTTLAEELWPGGRWLPATEIVLPKIFDAQCRKVAAERQKRVRRFSLDNKHGAPRTMEEEVRVAKGQYAACLMLEMPFNKYITHSVAKARGNLGFGVSAFVPQPGRYNLFIGEDTPSSRLMVLILDHGNDRFGFAGWIRAGAAMDDKYRREFVRDGVVSHPFVVPIDYLSAPETWVTPAAAVA
jgi:hypothetical protein